MADWHKIGSRGSVDDRRSASGVAVGSAGLLSVVILLLNIFGGNNQTTQLVSSVLTQLQNGQVSQQGATTTFADPRNYKEFASTILGSNNQTWKDYVTKSGRTYTEPTLVLFRSATRSGCGIATSDIGPHYCPTDKTIYLDETFFEELQARFNAKGGDVAEAYVIAHEVAHHVQNELGIMQEVQRLSAKAPRQANDYSIRTELQADCFAGIWAGSVAKQGVIALDEITEAIDAAAAVGDDRIQKSINGAVNPETWTHGSSEQRVRWFTVGYNTGEPAKCETFAANAL